MAIDDKKYPELAKMEAARNEGSQAIGNFIEWLKEEGYTICVESDSRGHGLVPAYRPTEQLLADYFQIDLVKVENERRALLEEFTAQTNGGTK